MKLKHYYHIYAEGNWFPPYSEHLEALEQSGLLGELDFIGIGIVGSEKKRQEVKEVLPPNFVVVAEADNGWEQVTLDAIDTSEKCYIMYAHTKGASNPDKFRNLWRESMTNGVVYGWRLCVKLLEDGNSAVGCYWRDRPWNHFSGTFWWSTSEYLKTLPNPCPAVTRFDAERWIGMGLKGARMADLCPGPVHRLNVVRKTDYTEEKGEDNFDDGTVTFLANSRIAGFSMRTPQTARLTPFIKNCIDAGHFTVLTKTASAIKQFVIK